MIEKCSPAEMRKNLMIVDELKRAGIDFVAVPVISEAQKVHLLNQLRQTLLEIEKANPAWSNRMIEVGV